MAYKERFKQARELNRLTQAQVADVVGVNQSAIAHIENGRRVPTADLIQGIAQATRVTSAFFERKPVAPFPPGSLTYRARSVARAADRGQAYQFVSLLVEQTQIMADHLSLPQLLLPQADNPVEAARLTRTAWEVDPLIPMPHTINLFERHGGVTFNLPIVLDRIDAFSTWAMVDGERPVIALSAGCPGDRIRFSVAHELGHLVMHKGQETPNLEREANLFAAELLLPSDAMLRTLSENLTLSNAARLKGRWGVSIQMIVRRARDLGVITERRYRSLFKQIGMRGWRKAEPVEVAAERPRLYRQMAEMIYGSGPDTPMKFAAASDIRVGLAEDLLGQYNLSLSASDLNSTEPYRAGILANSNN